MRRAEFSTGWVLLTLTFSVIGGVQVGLYLADWYDDGIAEPLSLWIGVGILVVAGTLAALPFLRVSRSR